MIQSRQHELRRLIFGDLVRMPISRIQLLGNFQLTSDDQVVTALNDEREQTLLAYLLLNQGTILDRNDLVRCLWSALSP